MQQAQDHGEGILQHALRHCLGTRIVAVEAHLAGLDVPIAVLAPNEFLQGTTGFAEVELVQQPRNLRNRMVAATDDPAGPRAKAGRRPAPALWSLLLPGGC